MKWMLIIALLATVTAVALVGTPGAAGDRKEISKKELNSNVMIREKWDLPDILFEVSAIAALGDGRFACVQDELGKIFFYNTGSGKIEREVDFADPGDYEGIALGGSTAYVVRSDGRIFEVSNLFSDKPLTKQIETPLTSIQNVESLCLDKKSNRLLLAAKGKDLQEEPFKAIYSLSLSNKSFDKEPVYRIKMDEANFPAKKKKNKRPLLQPSAIAIHPLTSEIYVADGPAARLLILQKDGALKSVIELGKSSFPKAEGISFNKEGEMYISNEGNKKQPANLLLVELKN